MDVTKDCRTTWSKSGRVQSWYVITCMWNLEKWYRWSYLQGRNRDTDLKTRTCGHRGGRRNEVKWSSVVSDSLQPHGLSRPEYWVGSLSLLQGIFLTQGSNPGLPHHRRILSQLSHKGSPRILEWVAYPFSSGSGFPSQESDWGLLHCRWILYQLRYQGRREWDKLRE